MAKTGDRTGGRAPDQLRQLRCELSSARRADGSVSWSQEGTTVMAAVHGPRQVQQRKENAERGIVEVVFKPRCGLQEAIDKEYEAVIREALEGVVSLGQYPRTSIMVTLQVLTDDGCVLAVALNAACAALVDAGVAMQSMFSAVTCGFLQGDQVLVDPDDGECKSCRQLVTLSFCHTWPVNDTSDPVVDPGVLVCHAQANTWCDSGVLSSGDMSLSVDQLLDTLDTGRLKCGQIAQFMKVAHSKALR